MIVQQFGSLATNSPELILKERSYNRPTSGWDFWWVKQQIYRCISCRLQCHEEASSNTSGCELNNDNLHSLLMEPPLQTMLGGIKHLTVAYSGWSWTF